MGRDGAFICLEFPKNTVLTASPHEVIVGTITVANIALEMPSIRLELPSNHGIVYTWVGMVHCHA
jgi:hypothetical protein